MDWESLFKSLPEFIKLFVPGYIYIYLYRFFKGTEADSFEATVVISVIASYVFSLIVQFIALLMPMTEACSDLSTIIVSVIAAVLLSIVRRKKWWKKVVGGIGKITGNKYIWEDILDLDKGSHIRCYTTYRHSKALVEGDVKYYSVSKDGHCQLALIKYKVNYLEKNEYDPCGNIEEPIMYLNTADVHGIEVTYGKEKV